MQTNKTTRPDVVRVTELVDGAKLGPFLLSIVFLGFLCQMGDGYDLSAAAFAAIGITQEWGIERHLLTPIFSASLFGMLFGALGFGYIGDRFGRRIAIMACTLSCGIFSLLTATADSISTLILFRFLTGLALGGLPANTVALTAEYAPARMRAVLITLMFMGLTLGGSLPGQLGSIIPHSQWRLMFVVGGIAPIAACILTFFFMPESMKFLAVRDPKDPRILKYARKVRPDLAIPDDVTFQIMHLAEKNFRIGQLFQGKLKIITPLLWAMAIANLLANFFLNSWMPTLLHSIGLSPHDAESTASMYYFGGIIGGMAMAFAIDKAKLWVVPVYMGLGAPVVIWLGTQNLPIMLKLGVFLVGVLVLGNQLGLNALIGLCYPTQIRANGTGWGLGIGRFGAIAGPIIGGALIHLHLPMSVLFCVPAVSLVCGCIATSFLSVVAKDRFVRGPSATNVDVPEEKVSMSH